MSHKIESTKPHLVCPLRSFGRAEIGRERDAGVHARLDKGFAARPYVRAVPNLDGPISTTKKGINVWEARVWGVFLEFANIPGQQSYRREVRKRSEVRAC